MLLLIREAARRENGGLMGSGMVAAAIVCMVCMGMRVWPFAPLLIVGIPLVMMDPGRLQEVWRGRVKLRRRARVERAQELKYPTYIRRWTPERRDAETRAHGAYDDLFNALLEQAG
ncbi:hypothetical protein [Sinomonas atrocyanea]|uniref:hypothetical protein n=1 Tax=Sinomonas atrocyanea TaxID=37927 RepID=UPI0027D8480C|nr:hypothetical protein [Sinomonas atrocyanea]